MKELEKGTYFGSNYQKSVLDGLIITDTEYTHAKVDWHRHENPYFTYLLQGKLYEANKSQEHYLDAGGLLFHNWQDSHYNIKPDEYTRGFHVELNQSWFTQQELLKTCIEGSHCIQSPVIKSLMNLIFLESKINDDYSQLSIDGLLLTVFNHLSEDVKSRDKKLPQWAKELNEFINDTVENPSLNQLSAMLGIHPVHLSREFHKFFGSSFGKYIRHIRVNKAFNLLLNSNLPMTEICYVCGFYDQSHFIRDFKRIYSRTPKKLKLVVQNFLTG